jgi:zinc/manganese transport system substrate-binding protein
MLLAAMALSGCAVDTSAADGRVQVVTSTDVYAAIVRAITGSRVDVTALIDSPAQDPHSFEASARNELAIARADVVIENGGGYDDFMNQLRQAAGKSGATTLDVVAISGHTAPPGGDLNEHVWYDFGSIQRFVARLVAVLSTRLPAQAHAFDASAARFVAALHRLETTESALRARYGGTSVAITEPVPDYLLSACGLVNRTPEQFSAAVEGGTDVSALVLEHTLALFDQHIVHALVYNEQSAGAETTRVLAAAHADDIPVVPVTETLPNTTIGYLGWMRANLAALTTALAR